MKDLARIEDGEVSIKGIHFGISMTEWQQKNLVAHINAAASSWASSLVEEAVKDLRPYLRHKNLCEIDSGTCDCGLEEAIRARTGGGK